MARKASEELLALDKKEGRPIALLRDILDVVGARYDTPEPEEKDSVIREYNDITLDPFAEPEAVFFGWKEGDLRFVFFIEHLTKIRGVSARSEIKRILDSSEEHLKLYKRPKQQRIMSSDVIIHHHLVYNLASGVTDVEGGGRILIETKPHTAGPSDLRIYVETKGAGVTGGGTSEIKIIIPHCLDHEAELQQTVEIIIDKDMEGTISVWHWD